MKLIAWLTRNFDWYQIVCLLYGIGAVIAIGLVFSIGIAVGRWVGA